MKRRTLLKTPIFALAASSALISLRANAGGRSELTLALPFDVQGWDPTARIIPQATSLYKTVFDQPLEYDQANTLSPGVISDYRWIGEKGMTLEITLRDDVYFHNGDQLSSEDFKYTFFDRLKADNSIQLGYIWNHVSAIDTPAPTKAVIHLSEPFVTAPQYLGFAGSFILPKRYIEKVGMDAFLKHPIGSGPYQLVDYKRGNRIVLKAFDKYWAGKPQIENLNIMVIPTATSRVAAIQSGQVQFSYALPIRESLRLDKNPNLNGQIDATIDTYIIQMVNKGALKDKNVRLAMHHAINKEAICKALLSGVSKPINTACPPGTPAYDADFSFDFDQTRARELLTQSGYGPDNPVKFTFFATNGVFPADNQMARAIVQMWKQIGIEADLQTIDFGKYFQEVAAGTLEGPALWLWNNSTGDPELYSGSYLNSKTIFSVWKSEEVMTRLSPLLVELDYPKRIAAYKEFNRWTVSEGYNIPLMEGVISIADAQKLAYVPYRNGWIIPEKWRWS